MATHTKESRALKLCEKLVSSFLEFFIYDDTSGCRRIVARNPHELIVLELPVNDDHNMLRGVWGVGSSPGIVGHMTNVIRGTAAKYDPVFRYEALPERIADPLDKMDQLRAGNVPYKEVKLSRSDFRLLARRIRLEESYLEAGQEWLRHRVLLLDEGNGSILFCSSNGLVFMAIRVAQNAGIVDAKMHSSVPTEVLAFLNRLISWSADVHIRYGESGLLMYSKYFYYYLLSATDNTLMKDLKEYENLLSTEFDLVGTISVGDDSATNVQDSLTDIKEHIFAVLPKKLCGLLEPQDTFHVYLSGTAIKGVCTPKYGNEFLFIVTR